MRLASFFFSFCTRTPSEIRDLYKSISMPYSQLLMYYTHPKVIPWGRTNKQTDKRRDGQMNRRPNGQIFTQYSGISSHSLGGVWILVLLRNPLFLLLKVTFFRLWSARSSSSSCRAVSLAWTNWPMTGIPTPRKPHYQALASFLVWPTPLSYLVTEYLASQEYNRDIPLATTTQE